MRIILSIIIVIIFTEVVCGQQVEFRGEPIDTLQIYSHSSVYRFDKKGTTKGEAEYFLLVYDKMNNFYRVYSHYYDKYKRTIRPDTIKINTHTIKKYQNKKVPSEDILMLVSSLNKSEKPSEYVNDVDSLYFKTLVNEKQIKKIAQQEGVTFQFKKNRNSEENNLFFKKCQSLDTLKLYLIECFDIIDTMSYMVITDVSRTINIRIITNKTTYFFEGKYPNIVNQPWYDHSDTTNFAKSVLNLNINFALEKVLPKRFMSLETISMKEIMNLYILWYLERNRMKY